MTPEALAKECIRCLATQPGAPFIVVIGKLPQKGWPRGKCVGSDRRGRFYMYDAAKILARLFLLNVVRIQTVAEGEFGSDDRVYRSKVTVLATGEETTLEPGGHNRLFSAVHGYMFRSKDYASSVPEIQTA